MQNIFYKNKENFDKTLEKIKKDGFKNLHVLADFDRTLTKAFSNGKKRPSLISVLRSEGYLDEEYSKKAYELFDYYNPIEINPNIDLQTKKKEMNAWWSAHNNLLIEKGLNKTDIQKVIDSRIIELRSGIKDFLKFLDEKDIPIVIISANGLGTNSIKIYLKQEGFLTENTKIISNEFIFDDKGKSIDYDKRVIHVFNKDETVLKDYPKIYNLVKNRKNIILLGDSLGDVNMADGFEYKNILRIGFLNDKEDELMDIYKEKYDVVLTGDNSGELVNELFR